MRGVQIRILVAGVACAVTISSCGSAQTTQSSSASSYPIVAATPTASQLPSATATLVPSLKAPSGSFTATGSLGSAREGATATTLRDGRVLIAGGENGYEGTYETAELYDPSSGTFSPTGPMAVQRFGHTATLLADGRVLVVGGDTAGAELYDPATGTFSPTGSMSVAGRFHAAVLLADGRVLVAGGEGSGTAELYDPATGKFSPAGSIGVGPGRMLDQPTNASGAIALRDGRVLVLDMATRHVQIFEPATGKFASTGSMNVARQAYSATLLADGRVLVAGGLAPVRRPGQLEVNPNDALASAEIYDPATGKFSLTGSMIAARYDQGALLLDDGRVLVIGGDGKDGASSCELFDPATATFKATGSMPDTRGMYALTRLADGRALLVGGSWYGNIAGSDTALIYQP